MAASLRHALACLAIAFALAPTHSFAEPQNGWWWNPDESGRGYFIEMTGGVMYLAGYFYDANGRATWLSSGGPVTDPYSYSGTLQSYSAGQSVFGTYRPPAPAVDVGPVTVTFSDDSHGTLTWPGGTVKIERQIFGLDDPSVIRAGDPSDALFRPKTGWWWNSAESGSGYSVEIQGESAFIVAFMYDERGDPVWYFSAGPMSSPTHFEGDWLEFSGGQTLAGPYRRPTSKTLGRMSVDFAAFDDATITFTESASAKRNVNRAGFTRAKIAPRSRSTHARSQFPAPTWSAADFWPFFACRITQAFVVEAASSSGVLRRINTTKFKVLYKQVGAGRYTVDGGLSSYGVEIEVYDTDSGCVTRASKSDIAPLYGDLSISPYLFYNGKVLDPLGTDVTTITDSCVDDPSPHLDIAHVYVFAPIGNSFSMVQRPNPYPNYPEPYMRVTDTRTESDGSSYELTWECEAQAFPYPP
jgi:hypothetical protein